MERLLNWGTILKKRIIVFFIKRVLGQYLENPLHTHQLEFEGTSGYIKLSNLSLDPNLFQKTSSRIPLRIESSLIPVISLQVCWSQFFTKEIVIDIPEIIIDLHFLDDDKIVFDRQNHDFFEFKNSLYIDQDYLLDKDTLKPNDEDEIGSQKESGISYLESAIKKLFKNIKICIHKITINIQYDHLLQFQIDNLVCKLYNINIDKISVNLDNQEFLTINELYFSYPTDDETKENAKSTLIGKITSANIYINLPILVYLNDFNLVLLHTLNLIGERASSYLAQGLSERSFFENDKFIKKLRENYHKFCEIPEEQDTDSNSIGSFRLEINKINVTLESNQNILVLWVPDLSLEITDFTEVSAKLSLIELSQNQEKMIEAKKIGFHLKNNKDIIHIKSDQDSPSNYTYQISIGISSFTILYDLLFINNWFYLIETLNANYHTKQNLDIFWENIEKNPFLIMLKIPTFYLKLRVPIPSSFNNKIVYYPYCLMFKSNNTVGMFCNHKFKFRLPGLTGYLSDDILDFDSWTLEKNYGEKFFETEKLDLAFRFVQLKTKSNLPFVGQKNFFSNKTIHLSDIGEFYFSPSDSEFKNFRKRIDSNSNTKINITFDGETHLFITPEYTHYALLIKGITCYKSPFKPIDSYLTIDLSLKTLYLLFREKYALKLEHLDFYAAANTVSSSQYIYMTIGDAFLWNQIDKSLICRKIDSRSKTILTLSIQNLFYPEINQQCSIISLDFKKILFEYHYLAEQDKKFWLWDLLSMLEVDEICYCSFLEKKEEDKCQCFSEENVFKTSRIFISSQETFLNYYLKGNQFQLKANELYYLYKKRDQNQSRQAVLVNGLKVFLLNNGNKIQIMNSKFLEWNLQKKNPLISSEKLVLHLTKDVLYELKKTQFENIETKEYLDHYVSDVDTTLVENLISEALKMDCSKSIKLKLSQINNLGFRMHSPKNSIGSPISSQSQSLSLPYEKSSKTIKFSNIEINLYQGLDFDNMRNTNKLIKLELYNFHWEISSKQNPQCIERLITSHLIEIENYQISGDLSSNLKPKPELRKYLGKMKPHQINHLKWKPKMPTDQALVLNLKSVDGIVSIDYDISLYITPSKIYINQHLINFLLEYYKYFQIHDQNQFHVVDIDDNKDPSYFSNMLIDQLYLQISYSSNLLDLQLPNEFLLLNFLQVDRLDLIFKPYMFGQILGKENLIENIKNHYIEIIKNEKKFKVIKSLRPIKSIVRFGNGILNLILIPSKEVTSGKSVVASINNDEPYQIMGKTVDLTGDFTDQTIEIFDDANYEDIGQQDAVILIPYNQYNPSGIKSTIDGFMKGSLNPLNSLTKGLFSLKNYFGNTF